MFGSVQTVGEAGVFGQVMGVVAVTVAFFTLGAYLGRHFTEGTSLICFFAGFGCIIGLNFARRSEALAITLLFAAGLALGLGLGGGLSSYAEFQPEVVWQAAGATALFVADGERRLHDPPGPVGWVPLPVHRPARFDRVRLHRPVRVDAAPA